MGLISPKMKDTLDPFDWALIPIQIFGFRYRVNVLKGTEIPICLKFWSFSLAYEYNLCKFLICLISVNLFSCMSCSNKPMLSLKTGFSLAVSVKD